MDIWEEKHEQDNWRIPKLSGIAKKMGKVEKIEKIEVRIKKKSNAEMRKKINRKKESLQKVKFSCVPDSLKKFER